MLNVSSDVLYLVDLTHSLIAEQRERDKRKLNMILHGTEESTSENSQSRKQDDITSLNFIFAKYLNITPTIITNAIRLGKKDSDKPRLIKITLNSFEEKPLVLQNKFKLKNEKDPDSIKKIYINSDLTPLEQRKCKDLRQQLADLNKESNNTYTI